MSNNPQLPTKTGSVAMPSEWASPNYNEAASILGGTRGFGNSKYLSGITPEEFKPSNIKAANQGFFAELGNSLAQTGAEIGLGTIEGAGYLGIGELVDKINNSEKEFGNSISEWANGVNEQFKQEVVPIYNSEKYNDVSEWFFENMPSIASAVSLMVPAMGASKAVTGTARMLGGSKLLKAAGIMKGTEAAQLIGGGGEAITMALASRHMENMMEGKEQYDAVYNEAISKGFSEELSIKAAKEAAQTTYNKNWALLATDVIQYGMLMKTFGSASRAGLAREIAKKNGSTVKSLLTQAGIEASEEGYQYIVGQEASREALIDNSIRKDDGKIYAERLLDYASDGDFWNSAFFGALGGAVFDYAGNKIGQKSQKLVQERDNIIKEELKKQTAAVQNDPIKFRELSEADMYKTIFEHIERGRADQAESFFNLMEKTADPNIPQADQQEIKNKAAQAKVELKEFEQLYNKIKLTNTPEVTRGIMVNRAQYKITSKSLLQNTELATKELTKVGTENGLDSSMMELLQANKDLEVIKSIPQTDNRQKALNDKIKTLTDVIKTNTNLTDAQIAEKLKTPDLSLFKSYNDNRVIDSVKLDKITADYNALQTVEGKEKLANTIQKHKAAKEDAQFTSISNSITPDTNTAQLEELRKSATEINKAKEFENEYNKKLVEYKTTSAKFNPTNVEASLRDRWTNNLLKEFEQSKITNIMLQSGGIPDNAVIDPTNVANVFATNPLFAQNLTKYYANANSITKITEKDIKKQPISTSTVDQNELKQQVNKVIKESKTLANKFSAWNTQGYQFVYSNGEFNMKAPNQASIAKKIDWKLVNTNDIPIGSTLHIEYDFNEAYNNLDTTTSDDALFELVYYKDKNIDNKATSNRSVVGALTAYAENREFNSKEEAVALQSLREKLFNEAIKSPFKKGYVTLTPTTKLKSYDGGRIWNTPTFNNPKDVLGNEELILGIGQFVNKQPTINVNGHPITDKIFPPKSITPGMVYMFIKSPIGNYIPYKMFTKKVNQFPQVLETIKASIEALKTVPSEAARKEIVDAINSQASIQDAYYKNGVYYITIGAEETPEVLQASDGTLDQVIGNLIMQVDINRINRTENGVKYNDILANNGYIVTDLNPTEHFHSTRLVIDPITEKSLFNTKEFQKAMDETPIGFTTKQTAGSTTLKKIEGVGTTKIVLGDVNQSERDRNTVTGANSTEYYKENGKWYQVGNGNKEYTGPFIKLFEEQLAKNEELRKAGKKFKIVEENSYTLLNESEVTSWFIKNLPQVPVEIVPNLIEVSKNGAQAWGMFKGNGITLYNSAPNTVPYHEAFHAVYNLFLTEKERESIATESQLNEEQLADAFGEYIQQNQSNEASLGWNVRQFFRKLWNTLKSLFTDQINLDGLFERINTGYYRNKPLPAVNLDPRYKVKEDPITARKRVALINYQFFNILDELRQNDATLTDLSDTDLINALKSRNQVSTKDVLISIYGRINNGLVDLHDSLPDTDLRKAKIADLAIQFFERDATGEITAIGGYFGKALSDLSKYGINITVEESFDDITGEALMEVTEEATTEQIFDQVRIEMNPKDTLSYVVRKTLRQTERWAYNKFTNEFTQDATVLDDLGFKSYVNFDEIENYLRAELSGIYDTDDMMQVLQDLQFKRPEIHGIVNRLDNDDILKSSFFSDFAGAYFPFIQVQKDTQVRSDIEGNYNVNRFKVYNANRKGVTQLIVDQWNTNLTTVANNEITDKDGKILPELASASFKDYTDLVAQIVKSSNITNEQAVELHTLLKDFGIEINPQVFINEFDEKTSWTNRQLVTITPIQNLRSFLEGKDSIKTILSSIALGNNPYQGDTAESTSIKRVAKIVASNEANLHQDSIINIEGKVVYSYTLPTFLSKKIEELKNPETRQKYLNNWWFSRNKWLQDLNDPNNTQLLEDFTVNIYDGLRLSDSDSSKFFDQTEKDLAVSDINLFDNNGNTTAYYRTPILSDSSLAAIIKFKKYEKEEVVNALYDLALAEQERQQMVSQLDIQIDNFNKNGLQYQFVTVFNNSNIDVNNPVQAKDAIRNWMNDELSKEKSRLQGLGILDNSNQFTKDKTGQNESVDSIRFATTNASDKLLEDYFYNTVLAKASILQISSVDLAFYKNYDLFQKRNGQVFKFTQMLDDTAIWKDGTATGKQYSGIYLKDEIIQSELAVETKKVLTKEGYTEQDIIAYSSVYNNVNQTDAQTYITLDRYKKIMIGQGKWNDKYEQAFQLAKKGKAWDKSFGVFFQPIKPFYFDHTDLNNIIVPVQHKNSEVILLPILTKGNPKLKKLVEYMESNQIDSALFTSAVKVGGFGARSFDEFNAGLEPIKHTFNNKYWGIQQQVPLHHQDTENLFGVQVRKLAMVDLPADIKILGRDKKDIFEVYQKLITDNIQESYNEVAGEFASLEKIQKVLLDQIKSRNLGENYEQAVGLVTDSQGNKVFNIPLFDPIHNRRMQNILNSIIRKNIFKQKINGASLVLMSNFGISKDLKVVMNEKGGVDHMEVMLPAWMKNKFPRKPNGSVDFEAIQNEAPELLDLFGYRIPTEYFYSMKKLKVVGFTPDYMGGVAILPAEITSLAGEDFDIDKMYVMIPNSEEKNGKLQKVRYDLNDISNMSKEQRDNALIDIISAVWSHQQMADKVLIPGGFETLKKLNSEIQDKLGLSNSDLNPIFPRSDAEFFNRNANGSKLIGVAANHNSSHAITQYTELQLKEPIIFDGVNNGLGARDLTRINSLDENSTISKNLAEFLAAFVDNAKDPVANSLNINLFTFDTIALLVRLGYNLETAILFINQPILREFVKRYNNTNQSRASISQVRKDLDRFLTEQTKATIENVAWPMRTSDLRSNIGNLLDLNQEELIIQTKVLNTFFAIKEQASSLGNLVRATKSDTLGTGKTMADTNFFLEAIRKVKNDKNLIGVQSVFDIPLVAKSNEVLQRSQDELLAKYFPYNGQLFVQVLADAQNIKGDNLNQDEANYLYTQFIHFYASGFKFFKPEDRNAFVNNFPTKFNEYKKDPELNQYDLMKYLKYTPVAPGNKVHRIEASSTATISNDQRQIISDSWNSMLQSDNKKVSDAAKNLIKYSFYTTYFGFNYTGFSQFIPIDYLEQITDQDGITYRDHLYKLLEDNNSTYYSKLFLDQLYRHQAQNTTLLRKVSLKDVSSHTKQKKNIIPSLLLSKEKAKEGGYYDGQGNLAVTRVKLRNTLGYNTYAYVGTTADGQLIFNIQENLGYDKFITEFSKDGYVDSVVKQNKLPELLEEDFYNNVAENEEKLYQIENNEPSKKANEDLNNSLKTWLTSFGITVEYHNNLQEKLGYDAIGMADIYKKLILISQSKENIATLPEEVGHFAEAYSRGQSFHNRLMELIDKTQTYKDVVAKYNDIYKGDTTKLRQEAIGQLIGEALIRKDENTRKNTNNAILQFLQGLWSKFVGIFKRGNVNDIQEEINKITDFVANEILTNKTDNFTPKNIQIGDEFFQLVDDTSILTEKQVLENAIDSIYKKVKIYAEKGSTTYVEREEKVLKDLTDQFNKTQYNLGLLNYVDNAIIELDNVAERYNSIKQLSPTNLEDRTELVRTIRSAQNYVNGFKETISGIANLQPFTKENNDKVDVLSKTIDRLEKDYLNIGKALLADIFKEYSTNPGLDIKKVLEVLDKDISFTQKNLDSIAEASDPILRILDVLVKDNLEIYRKRTTDIGKDLVAAQKELEKAGVASNNFVYERDFEGNITGNIISEYNIGEFEKRKKKFFTENPKPLDLPAQKAWKQKVAKWFDQNTQANPNRVAIMKKKEIDLIAQYGQKLGKEKYNQWLEDNTLQTGVFDPETGDLFIKFIKELASPSIQYKSSQYAAMKQNPAMQKYYNTLRDTMDKMGEELPDKYQLDGLMPQTRKDFYERLSYVDASGKKRLRSAKDVVREGRETISEVFNRKEDDIDFGLTDENGDPINAVPMFFTRKLKNMQDLSLDATSAVIAYVNSANNFLALSKVSDVAELTKDIVAEREVLTGKLDPLTLMSTTLKGDKKVKNITTEGDKSNAYKRLDDYIKMLIYGQNKKVEMLGSVDAGKAADLFNQYTSLTSLALNAYAGTANILFGNAMVRMEGFAGEVIDNISLLEADKIYTTELPKLLGDIGQRNESSKLNLWLEYMNTMQDYNKELNNADAARSTIFGRLFKQSSLYFLNRAGEHYIQSRISLALGQRTKVKDALGTEMSLYDAFDIVVESNGVSKLKLKEGIRKVAGKKTSDLFKKSEDGELLTERDINRFINRQNWLNKRLNGIYNNVDKSSIQQYALGRMALMFRKFIKPGWNRRFEKLTYSEEGEIYTEGYYTTLGRFMKSLFKDLADMKFQLGSRWKDLNDTEKSNMYRVATEVAFLFATAIIGSLLTNLSDDDEENQLLAFSAYQALRLHSELQFYINYQEALRIVKSPAAGVNQIDKLSRALAVWNWADVYERGKFKGLTKFEVSLIENIPLTGTYVNFKSPEEQLKFFSSSPPVMVSITNTIYE